MRYARRMDPTAQLQRAERFRDLHAGPRVLVMPNPWDAGSAKLLASLGFDALATTSLGLANMLGVSDGEGLVSRYDVLENCRAICDATSLPVSADLENCYAHSPKQAATMITDGADAGLVGGSIEDSTGDAAKPIYDFALAVERVQAAVEAARALPFPFTLTARAENFLHGIRDMDDTLKRLQAFEKAGADVLYAPGLKTLDEVKTVVAAVSKPVNVVMSSLPPSTTAQDLETLGVRRISIGGAFSRVALGAMFRAAQDLRTGSFAWNTDVMPTKDFKAIFKAPR